MTLLTASFKRFFLRALGLPKAPPGPFVSPSFPAAAPPLGPVLPASIGFLPPRGPARDVLDGTTAALSTLIQIVVEGFPLN